jgi:Flp pilus assembly protein TadG
MMRLKRARPANRHMKSMLRDILGRVRAFARAQSANVAMTFAISLIPLCLAGGAGIDMARAYMVRSAMAEALDAAALAVGASSGKPSSCDTSKSGASQACQDLQKLAQKYFDSNYKTDTTNYGTPSDVTLVIIPQTTANGVTSAPTIKLNVTDDLPTTLFRFAGYKTVTVAASSTVVWGNAKLWVALVLDNSGSMRDSSNGKSKMDMLQSASHSLLDDLEAAATNDGDVKVAIIPFDREVNLGKSNKGASWLRWTEWEAPPANAPALSSSLGPGDNCPFDFGSRNQGYGCQRSSSNDAGCTNSRYSSCVSRIPSSGLICPGPDDGSSNSDHRDRFYNGCYASNASSRVVDSGSRASCDGYSHCDCSGSGSRKVCTQTTYSHPWVANDHSTWGGCIMDRYKDYDESNAAPSGSSTTGFPADNPTNCLGATVTALSYDWTTLNSQIDKMAPNGSTNQGIGVAHGWQALTPSTAPYSPPALPDGTARYMILLSDGLNTQDRWYGDGSSTGTSDDQAIDARMKQACTNAKADGIVIYTLFLDVGGTQGNSDPLQQCASDSSKYYDLTSADQIATAFDDIAKKITNLRVSQ